MRRLRRLPAAGEMTSSAVRAWAGCCSCDRLAVVLGSTLPTLVDEWHRARIDGVAVGIVELRLERLEFRFDHPQ